MKTPASFRLTEQEIEIINQQAKRFNCSKNRALEIMVGSFRASTREEVKASIKKREDARRLYVLSHPNKDGQAVARAWTNGFNMGWNQFQTRHADSPFVREDR